MSARSNKPVILVGRVEGDPADLPEGMVYHPGRDPGAPRRVSQEVEVIADPRQIAWARRAYNADVDYRFQDALEQVRAGEWVYLEYLDALRRRPKQASTELTRIMDDEAAPAKGRARAAEVLVSLGKAQGVRFLVAALRSSSTDLCAAAVEMLGEWNSKIDLTRPAIARQIIKLLSSPDPEVVRKAAHLCAWRKVPGAEEGLRAAITKGGRPLEELAESLARLATKPESIQAALPHLFNKRQKEYTSSINFYFRQVIDHSDSAISRPFRQAMQRYLLTYTGKDRLGQHWAGDLASVADETVIPVLEHIVTKAKDPVSRAYALEALGRLQPERAVGRALAELKRQRPFDILIRVLETHVVADDFERVRRALYPASGAGKDRQLHSQDARLLLEKFGPPGRELLLKKMDKLDNHAREWVTWKLQGLDVRTALAELHAAKVIRQRPEELLAQMAERREDEDEPLDTTGPAVLTRALGQAGLVTHFDTESGFVPCHHEGLIREFAEGSGGEFTPECPVQIWHRHDEDDYDSPYTVQFIYRKRLYRLAAENYGDYYDVEAVVRALNKALEANGRPERYVGLYTGDQCASFVFADPKVFVPIAEKYGLPLSESPSEAMRAGRAFDQHVFDSLEPDE
jgi:HEAT repeat protein